jgi:hypothetical protein
MGNTFCSDENSMVLDSNNESTEVYIQAVENYIKSLVKSNDVLGGGFGDSIKNKAKDLATVASKSALQASITHIKQEIDNLPEGPEKEVKKATYTSLENKLASMNSPTVGGYVSLENYSNSLFSDAKEKLIRSIARDVAGVLKINPSFADSADIEKVITAFSNVVPDPRKNKKIKVDSKIHVEICKKIAKSINKNYKIDMINEDDSAENICKAVSETLYSLFTGLHSEFLSVAADVSRIIKNLNILQDYVDGKQ